ncbi:MAG: type IVB secretion system protein IcmV [Gammaproteobacteria bacterium]
MAKKKSGLWRNTFRSAIDVPQWMGYDWLIYPFAAIANQAKRFFIPQNAHRKESFEEAIARLQLTESQLFVQQKNCMRLAITFFVMALLTLFNALYLFWSTAFFGGGFSVILALCCLAFAFRYHFWVFQIRNRKLGCSIEDWWFSHSKGHIDNS